MQDQPTLVQLIDASALGMIPQGSTLHPSPVVSVGSELWLLIATRRNPQTGRMNALLAAVDGSVAAVCPAAMVCGWRHVDLELARQENPDLAPEPVEPQMLGPVTVTSLHRQRITEVFDQAERDTSGFERIEAAGKVFLKVE